MIVQVKANFTRVLWTKVNFSKIVWVNVNFKSGCVGKGGFQWCCADNSRF